jgi:hypothetical protein
MKKLETSQIIENVLSNGVITEREVLLLKNGQIMVIMKLQTFIPVVISK